MALPLESTPIISGEDAKIFMMLLNRDPTELEMRTYKKALNFYKEMKNGTSKL